MLSYTIFRHRLANHMGEGGDLSLQGKRLSRVSAMFQGVPAASQVPKLVLVGRSGDPPGVSVTPAGRQSARVCPFRPARGQHGLPRMGALRVEDHDLGFLALGVTGDDVSLVDGRADDHRMGVANAAMAQSEPGGSVAIERPRETGGGEKVLPPDMR